MSRKQTAVPPRSSHPRSQNYTQQSQFFADPFVRSRNSNAPPLVDSNPFDGYDAWAADSSALYPGSDWSLVGSQFVDGFEVTAMSFDSTEELLWCGSNSGRLSSIIPNTSIKYCSVQAHSESIVKIFPMEDGILSLSPNEMRMFSRGGLRLQTFSSDKIYNVQDACLSQGQGMRILLSGLARRSITELDLSTMSSPREIFVECGVASVNKSHRFIVAGCEDGCMRFYDPRVESKASQMFIRHANIQNVAVRGDLIAASGFVTNGYDGVIPDDQISFIDARMNRILYEYEYPGGCVSVKFHSTYSAVALALGGQGNIQFIDIQGAQPIIQDDILVDVNETEYPTIFCVSSTGHCMGVGSNIGSVQILADRQDFLVNSFQVGLADLRNVSHQLTESQIKMDFNSPLSAVMLPKLPDPLLSDYALARDPGLIRKPPILDPNLLLKMKQINNVGKISNPKIFKRNQIIPNQPKDKITILFSDFAYRRKKSNERIAFFTAK